MEGEQKKDETQQDSQPGSMLEALQQKEGNKNESQKDETKKEESKETKEEPKTDEEKKEDKDEKKEKSEDKDPNPKGKTYTEEEFQTAVKEAAEQAKKAYQSESEKGRQIIFDAFEELKTIATNPERLVDLEYEKPEVAQFIAKKYFNCSNMEEYKAKIGYKEDLQDPEKLKKKVEQMAEQIAYQKEFDKKRTAFEEKLKMNDTEKEKFSKLINTLTKEEKLDLENLQTFFTKAYIFATDNEEVIKKIEQTEEAAKEVELAGGKKKQKEPEEKSSGNDEIRELFEKFKDK